MVIIATLLTGLFSGCASNTQLQVKPIQPKLNKIKKCGKFKYEKQGHLLILDYKVAKCLKKQLIECAEDRKVLIEANKANVALINKLKGL